MERIPNLSIEWKLIGLLVFWGLFGWRYFKISKGTGIVLYLLISLVVGAGMVLWFPVFFSLGILLVIGLAGYDAVKKKPKRSYENTRAVFEGGGVKRGLTPPEAALILGKPIQDSIGLMLVGMLKKGFVQLTRADSIQIKMNEEFLTRDITLNPEKRSEIRKQKARALNQVIYPYEDPLLELLEQEREKNIAEIDFSILVKPFIEDLAFRIGGFNFEQTRDYYELIVRRAPKEARMEGKLVTDFRKVYGKNIGWILLSEELGTIIEDTDGQYQPAWLPEGADLISEWYPKLLRDLGSIDYRESIGIKLGKDISPEVAELLNNSAQLTYHR